MEHWEKCVVNLCLVGNRSANNSTSQLMEELTPKEIITKKFNHYTFVIVQLWLTSHLRSTVVLLDTGTQSTSRKIYSEDADKGIRTRNPSVINRVL